MKLRDLANSIVESIELIGQGERWELDQLIADDADMLDDDVSDYKLYDRNGEEITN